jgi:hypothetical protein
MLPAKYSCTSGVTTIAAMLTRSDVMKRQKASKKNVVIVVTCQIVCRGARQSICAVSCSRCATFVRSSVCRAALNKRNLGISLAHIEW